MNAETWIFIAVSVVSTVAALVLVKIYQHKLDEKNKIIRSLSDKLEALQLEFMRYKAGL